MKKFILFASFCFFFLFLSAQEKTLQDKVTLQTGEIYIGQIVLKTADMIMLSTKNGMRYQFQLSEIKSLETIAETSSVESADSRITSVVGANGNFGGLIELAAGISNAKNCFDWSPNTQLSLLFGNRRLLGENIFLGVGVGLNTTFVAHASSAVSFLPLYARIQCTLSKKRSAPYVAMDAGYALAVTDGYGGGTLVKVSAGITHRINYKTVFFAGVYAGVQAMRGPITEVNSMGTFSYQGDTSMKNLGLKLGLQF